ncbi:MAG: HAD-IC family P-type ATPase, partial [Cyclobacteriaceae bacterium]|nr:HAD-IC family P-type ATPase [Cyclobacteriaceae bacterium]
VNFVGYINQYEKSLIKSAVRNSSHPLSRSIYNFFNNVDLISVDEFKEISGEGIETVINGHKIKVGSQRLVSEDNSIANDSTSVYITIDNNNKGYFTISNKYRAGLKEIITALEKEYEISLLSGDNDSEKVRLREYFADDKELHFKQSPHDKLDYINNLQKNGKKVLMVGDGLNDAGALKQSDVGISISDNINNFSPACDGILDAQSFNRLSEFINFSKTSKKIIIASFILSFIYNIIGIAFAVSGSLSPIVAAILMPISSISVVVFTTFSVNFFARKKGFI